MRKYSVLSLAGLTLLSVFLLWVGWEFVFKDVIWPLSLLIGVCKFMRRTSWRTLGLVLAVLAGLATPPASAAESLTLLLRWDHQFQFAGYYAALWKGYYKDAGLDVTIRPPFKGKSVVNSIDEVMSGAADFGIGGADLLVARDKGIPVVTVGTIFHESAAEFYINRDSGYSSLRDLPRLRVARRIGDLIDTEFQAMLNAEGMNPDTVKPITSYGSEQAVADGSLDLTPGYSFVTPFILKELGVDFITLRPRDYGVHFYGDSLFTREDLIDRKEDAVNKFVTASLRGWQYALENSEEIADLIAEKLPRRFPVKDPVAFNRAQIEGVRKLTLYPIVEPGHMNPGRWQHMHKWLSDIGLVTGPLDIDRFIFDPKQRKLERQKFLIKGALVLGGLGAAIGVVLWIWVLRRTVAARTGELTDEFGERKRAERELEESRELLRALTDNLPQFISLKDTEGRFQFVNKRFEEWTDFGRDEVVGKTVHDIYPAEQAARFAVDDQEALDGRSILVQEFDLSFPDGHTRTVVSTRFPIKSQVGDLIGLGTINYDISERKRAEEALRASEERFRAVVDHSPGAIVIKDMEGRNLIANKLFCTWYGITSEKIIGKSVYDFYAKEISDRITAQEQEVVETKQVVQTERRVTFPDGVTRSVFSQKFPIFGPDGDCLAVGTVINDITERKRAEAALRESELRLKAIMNNAAVEITLKDLDGRLLMVNRTFEANHNLRQDELIGKTLEEIYSPEDAAVFTALERKVAETGEVIQQEVRPIRAPGVDLFLTTKFPIRNPKDEVVAIGTINTDISELGRTQDMLRQARDGLELRVRERTKELAEEVAMRTRAEAVLRESEKRLRLLLETTSAIPWESDAKTWLFTYVGPQAVALLGYPRERWLEKDFWIDHIHPEDRAWTVDYCLKSSNQHENYEFDYRMIAADGRSVWLHDVVNVMRQDGAPVILRGFMIDITERKQAEDSLRDLSARLITAQEEERSRLARELHDDFTQRLVVLAVDLEQLAGRQPASCEDFSDCLESLLRRTKELSSDVHRLSHQLHPSILQHLGLVAATRSFCKETSNQHAIHIELVHHGVPRSLPGNVALCLYRIVQEALRNVIKHSGADSARVEITGAADGLRLQISDNGTGFDPGSARTRGGLGLLSMRERLRLVSGTISFERIEPTGARIDVCIPLPDSDQQIASNQTGGRIAKMPDDNEPGREFC